MIGYESTLSRGVECLLFHCDTVWRDGKQSVLLVTLAVSISSCGGGTNSPSPPPPPTVQHAIGVRVTNGIGEFFNRQTGNSFIPRGNNYVRYAQQVFLPQMVIAQGHSTFNPGLYDQARVETALTQMELNGYNITKVWLNYCCQNGTVGNPNGTGLSVPYVANLVDFLNRASAHKIYVVITTDDLPWVGGYRDIMNQWCAQNNACDTYVGFNLQYLTQGGIDANTKFWQDLVQALKVQQAPFEAIFAYEIREEIYIDPTLPPLSLTSGLITTANEQTYDMSDPAAKLKLQADNLIHFTDLMRGSIQQLDPQALVAVGFFTFNDPLKIPPFPTIASSTMDFVDLHPYPGEGYTLGQAVQGWGMSGFTQKPIMMGEFGASTSSFTTEAAAAQALHDWQVQSCTFGFDGWLVWTWDTTEQTSFVHWPAISGNGLINQSLAPANRANACVP